MPINTKLTQIQRDFDKFRSSFSSRNVTVYNDSLVYRVPRGLSDRIAKDANDLIEKLNLPLVAIPTNLLAKDSFYVQRNENFDI